MKVVIIDMQPITPAVGGGRLRLLGLYHNLGEGHDATYVGTYDWEGEPARDHQVTERLREICVPLSSAQHAAARELSTRVHGATVIDSAFSMQAQLSPEWIETAARHIADADAVVFSHPWAFNPLRDSLKPGQLVVYDSHNVESVLKASLVGMEGDSQDLVREIVRNEYELCMRADLILACSQEDMDCFARMFGIPHRKMCIVPNGAFTEGHGNADEALRREVRESLGLPPNSQLAIFVGSNYGPNVAAAKFIAESLCREVPDVTFVVVGGVGNGVRALVTPANLRITGIVDDERRDRLLRAADIAINPMMGGSGTNIKMFDFLAAGLPVVTTEIGARGICDAISAPPFIFVRTLREFPEAVVSALQAGGSTLASERPEQFVERLFSWERIAPELGRLLDRKRAQLSRARRKAVVLSTWNVRCGIGEHTSHFVQEMEQQGWDVLVLGNETRGHHRTGFSADMHVPVSRLWRWDNHTWRSGIDLEALAALAEEDRPEVAVIQHHTAFMSAASYVDAMRVLTGAGIRVVMELHDARHVTKEVMSDFVEVADLVVLHDAQELEAVPPTRRSNVVVLPLPTPSPVAATHIDGVVDGVGPIISGFGFLRPYKGLLDVVRTIAELRERFPGIRYRGYHALYNTESSDHLAECMAEAERLGVKDHLEIDTGFHELDEVIAKIAAANVVLLPYKASNEGASAAVNSVLSAGRATVVSDAKIFKPVSKIVRVVPGENPSAYADAIAQLLTDPVERERLESAAREWTRDHSYPVIVDRMISQLLQKRASP